MRPDEGQATSSNTSKRPIRRSRRRRKSLAIEFRCTMPSRDGKIVFNSPGIWGMPVGVKNRESDRGGVRRVLLISLYGGIFTLALLARFAWVDSLPGVNGDEAWNGLWVEGLLHGQVWGGREPSGRYPDPFLLVPLAIVQAIADPAPWVLRVPTIISDLAFISVGYAGLRSTIGARPALVFALLAATTPITIIYSRFGWEASETPLAVMIFLWACLAGRRVAGIFSLCAAILVHPTNVFLFPVLVAFWLKYLQSLLPKITRNVAPGTLLSAVLIGGTLIAIPISLWLGRLPLGEILSGRLDPQHFVNALLRIGDLFSGITVYRYIAGEPVGLILHRVIISFVLAALVLSLCFGPRTTRDPRLLTLLAGLAVSVISFLIIAGWEGLHEGTERYALFMVAPVLVLLSAALARPFNVASTAGLWFAPFLGSLALISIWLNYFEPLRLSGGQARDTDAGRAFRTAPVEPKMQVARWVRECVGEHNDTVALLAESYWLTLPLQYYLFYEPKISVHQLGNNGWVPKGTHRYELSEVPNSNAIVVAFSGSYLDQELQNTTGSAENTIFDAAGRPFIHIYTKGLSTSRC
jgi:hypothetical protein